MFINVFTYKPFLFPTTGDLLLIAETKESLLFTRFASRLYFVPPVSDALSMRLGCHNIQEDSVSVDETLLSKGVS